MRLASLAAMAAPLQRPPAHAARWRTAAPGFVPFLDASAQRAPEHARRRPRCSASYSGAGIAPPEKGHHFLHIDDFSKDELWAMLETAQRVKEKLKAGDESYKPFAGKTMAMVFTKPSMRTRVSFETVRRPSRSQPQAPVAPAMRLQARLTAPALTRSRSRPVAGLFQAGGPRDLPGAGHHPVRQAGGHQGHRARARRVRPRPRPARLRHSAGAPEPRRRCGRTPVRRPKSVPALSTAPRGRRRRLRRGRGRLALGLSSGCAAAAAKPRSAPAAPPTWRAPGAARPGRRLGPRLWREG